MLRSSRVGIARGFAKCEAAFVFEGNRVKQKQTKAPKSCSGCKRLKDLTRRARISSFLEKAIKGVETKLESQDLKPSMADYMKLLQLERELDHDSPKEIKVTWVEPETESAGK
jgi:hypothetical protein